MGTCPDKFGPYFWGTLHLAALFGEDVGSLAASYTRNLPCPACRTHFSQVLQDSPVPKDASAEQVFLWSVDVHNIVNERLGKPKMDYATAFNKWSKCENQRARTGVIANWPVIVVVVAVLLALLIFVLRNK